MGDNNLLRFVVKLPTGCISLKFKQEFYRSISVLQKNLGKIRKEAILVCSFSIYLQS